jgi:hypothetical protein
VNLSGFPFTLTDWSRVEPVEHTADRAKGGRGTATWRTQHFGDIRVRMIEYSPGYLADHWCDKGHVVLCLKGEMHTELQDGRIVTLTPGMSYQVADKAERHRTRTNTGATLFVVD